MKKIKITALLLFYSVIAFHPGIGANTIPDGEESYKEIQKLLLQHFGDKEVSSDEKKQVLKAAIQADNNPDKTFLNCLIEDFLREKSYEDLKKYFMENLSLAYYEWFLSLGWGKARYGGLEEKDFARLLNDLLRAYSNHPSQTDSSSVISTPLANLDENQTELQLSSSEEEETDRGVQKVQSSKPVNSPSNTSSTREESSSSVQPNDFSAKPAKPAQFVQKNTENKWQIMVPITCVTFLALLVYHFRKKKKKGSKK